MPNKRIIFCYLMLKIFGERGFENQFISGFLG